MLHLEPDAMMEDFMPVLMLSQEQFPHSFFDELPHARTQDQLPK
jgi:hypothetical protein